MSTIRYLPMKKLLLFLSVLLIATLAKAQISTVYTGTIKDLSGAVVTTGQVTFILAPSTDSTISGIGRFVPSIITCRIDTDGTLSSSTGGACTVASNTALSPSGSSYRICIQPYFTSPGRCFFDYATTPSKDISTIAPALSTGPINYGGVPGPALNFVGAWNSSTVYQTGQTVTFGNIVYISLQNPNLNNNPAATPTFWSRVITPASLTALPGATQTVVQPAGTSFQMNSANNVLSADQFTGADIGAKINAAFSSCTIANKSCKVTLPPNAVYTYGTTIVVPFQGLSTQGTGYPILDCQGATLNYSGSGDAVLVPPKAVDGWFSGRLENCVINATTTSARSLIHTQSAIGFKIENIVLFGDNTPVCLKQENVNNGGTPWSNSTTYSEGDFVSLAGVTYTSKINSNLNNTPPNAAFWNVYAMSGPNPIWSEQMEVSKVSMEGCVKSVQLFTNGGTDSFDYNHWHDLFVSPGPNQTGVSIEGAITTIGSKLDLNANSTGTSGNQAHIVSATGGANGSFNTLTIRGESDGTVTDCSIFVDSASSVSAFGSLAGSAFTTCYGSGAVSSQIQVTGAVQTGLTNLQGNPDNGFEMQAGKGNRGQPQAANCKWDLLNGTPDLVSSVFQVGSAVFGLANPSGFSAPNCTFQIYRRTTTTAYPEVNVPGASGNPITNIFYTDSSTGFVGIGPGYGWNGSAWVNPAHQHEVSSPVSAAIVTPAAIFAPNLTTGHEVCQLLGKDTAIAQDSAQICFHYDSAGGALNFYSLGFPTAGDILRVYPDGHVQINGPINPNPGTTAPSGSCTKPGALSITADGHGTYCHAGTLVWTTLY
jgi:hypothetical protein